MATESIRSYPRFLWRSVVLATEGKLPFYAWMTVLTAISLVSIHAWSQQVAMGMGTAIAAGELYLVHAPVARCVVVSRPERGDVL